MPHPGRPKFFDSDKQNQYIALISVGCSQQTACDYCGVSATTVRNAARKDPTFHARLRKAEIHREFQALNNIVQAGASHWRASAWLLERTMPARYAPRKPQTITQEEWQRMLGQLGASLLNILPDQAARDALHAHLHAVVHHDPDDDDKDDEPTIASDPWPPAVEQCIERYDRHLPHPLESMDYREEQLPAPYVYHAFAAQAVAPSPAFVTEPCATIAPKRADLSQNSLPDEPSQETVIRCPIIT